MNELIKKIKGYGYWRILIRPNSYNPNLIPSLPEARQIIEGNKVRLRGWDYPHSDQVLNVASPDSIDSACDWKEGQVYEYWRYYLSGQFVHYFATREDSRIDANGGENIKARFPFGKDKLVNAKSFLGVLSTLYTFTEVFLFASRLAQKGYLGEESFHLEIELNGVNGRMLYIEDAARDLFNPYICTIPENKIVLSFDIPRADIIANYAELALNEVFKFFQSFNWPEPSRSVLKEDQRKFLERRF